MNYNKELTLMVITAMTCKKWQQWYNSMTTLEADFHVNEQASNDAYLNDTILEGCELTLKEVFEGLKLAGIIMTKDALIQFIKDNKVFLIPSTDQDGQIIGVSAITDIITVLMK